MINVLLLALVALLSIPPTALADHPIPVQELVLRAKPAVALVTARVDAEATVNCGAGAITGKPAPPRPPVPGPGAGAGGQARRGPRDGAGGCRGHGELRRGRDHGQARALRGDRHRLVHRRPRLPDHPR